MHLFSLRIGHALRESCFDGQPYGVTGVRKDILAGITVGIIAIPLAMALAIASGVPPQYGLYTAIIGGAVIALTGGSRYSISGPTAAFVVILFPIAREYGLAGLLIATFLAGLMLMAMAYARLGRFIEYIPEPVTLGFTGGIAIVIATLQLKDFLGLPLQELPELFVEKVWVIAGSLGQFNGASLVIAALTLGALHIWPKLKTPIPPHLPAVIFASLLGIALAHWGFEADTIGSRFHYLKADGSTGAGIPPYLPTLSLPWHRPGPDGQPLTLNWQLLVTLLPPAFAIAMLGAIESLLCAVVLDGMTGKRHSANSELLGQGLGNLVAPLFGGITATAAIARSVANLKAGAVSPVSAIVHSLVVLSGLMLCAPLLAYLPMPALAALLLMVAWNMSEAPKALTLVRRAPLRDVAIFVTCITLTVFTDMVIAITTGVLLASMLFVNEMAAMTKLTDITGNKKLIDVNIPPNWVVLKINGPLFFAAADRIFGEISALMRPLDGAILYLDGVTLLDSGGVSAMNKLVSYCAGEKKQIVFADFQFQPLKTLARAKVKPVDGVSAFYSTLHEAIHQFDEAKT